jgi:mono/diheme cytochrome c family protein
MRGPVRIFIAALVAVAAASCGEDPEARAEAAAAARAQAARDSVEMALVEWDPAAFDTIQWEKPADAIVRGSVVFSFSCARCHGRQGYGDGEFVTQGDTLRPPSFNAADWRFAGDPEGMRRFVFTGSENDMPHWGLHGLKYRDLDAVVQFILDLRSRMPAG